MDHWRRGHKQMCKKIHRGGNAEQYHADKKYKEAVAVAVEAYGNSHPTTIGIGEYLETSQAVLRARYKSRYSDILACSFAVALFAWVWWYLTNE